MSANLAAVRFVVAGCGTVVPEPDRACSCYYLEAGGIRVLLDCGAGALQALSRLRLPWDGITHLVLTHFHADHVGALPGLFFALKHGIPTRRQEPLDVWGPPGTRTFFQSLAAAFGGFVLDPGFQVRVNDIEAGDETDLGYLRLRTHKTPHTAESQAIRLETGAGAVTYSGDTGPDDGLGEFAGGSRLFVCECSLPDDLVGDNHLSPRGAATLATEAIPGHLLLTHIYPQLRAEGDVEALVRAAGYAGVVSLAREGWTMELNPA